MRYQAKQSEGFHWVVRDNETGRETMMDSPAAAKRLAKALNGPTYQQRIRAENPYHADEAAAMTDAFLDANPDCAF